jgi:CBS domain-containing protein
MGGRMVDFGGWDMPVQYPAGTMEEHLRTRRHSGLFDVSHMGEIEVRGPEAIAFVNYLTSNDVTKLIDGQAQYSLLCLPNGGVVDDIMVHRNEIVGIDIDTPMTEIIAQIASSQHTRLPVFKENINNVIGILRACQAGLGIAMLPDYIVEEDGGLVQLFGEQETIALDAYFVYPEELKSVARVQAFRDFVVSKAQRWNY